MIEDICRFVIVVNSQSITKAAKQLKITQPALSLSIRRLEKTTNTRVFLRIGKQITITQDGQSLYQIGVRILELWERAKNPHTRESSGKLITIGLFDNAALQLATFFQKKLGDPHMQIDIKIDNSVKLLQELNYGILDICVCVVDKKALIPKNAILIKEFIEELLPVSLKQRKVDSLSQVPFILYKRGSNTRIWLDEIFFKNAIQPIVVAESTSTSFMKALAMKGSGVTFLPRNFVLSEIANKKLIIQKLPFKFYRKIAIFVRKDGEMKPESSFVQELSTYLTT